MEKNKGITLIAVIITVIILLILAGITLIMTRKSGIIEKAELAKEITQQKQEEENTALTNYEMAIQEEMPKNSDMVTISKEEYERLKNNVNYSEEEQVIGTWIDGKPIYRKIFTTINETGGEYSQGVTFYGKDYDLQNLDTLITGKVLTTGNNGVNQETADVWYVRYNNSDAHKETWQINTLARYTGVTRYYIIIEYTKTTDNP